MNVTVEEREVRRTTYVVHCDDCRMTWPLNNYAAAHDFRSAHEEWHARIADTIRHAEERY